MSQQPASTSREMEASHSPELERAVLGAILMDNEMWWQVAEILPSHECFFRKANQLIYRTMMVMMDKGERIDALTLGEEVKRLGCLPEVGGYQYLADLVMQTPSAASAAHHARRVLEYAIRRQVAKEAAELFASASSATTDAFQLVEGCSTMATKVEEMGKGRSESSDGKSLAGFVRDISDAGVRARQTGEEDSAVQGYRTGLREVDKIMRMRSGDLIIVAARPSMGKTAYGLSIANYFIEQYGLPVDFYSLEMSPQKIALRLAALRTGITINELRRGAYSVEQMELFKNGLASIEAMPLHVIRPEKDLQKIRPTLNQMHRRHKSKLIILDYLSLIRVQGVRDRKDIEIGLITKMLKDAAGRLEVPIIALSQLNRASTHRDDKRPQLSDLKNSGDIEEDADIVKFIHRPEYYRQAEMTVRVDGNKITVPSPGKAEIIIAKNRDDATGEALVGYDGPRTLFHDVSQLEIPLPPAAPHYLERDEEPF